MKPMNLVPIESDRPDIAKMLNEQIEEFRRLVEARREKILSQIICEAKGTFLGEPFEYWVRMRAWAIENGWRPEERES